MDPDIGDYIRGYIQSYKLKNQVTILLASHNMNEVERLCSKVMMMKGGKIIDNGTCKDLITRHGRKNLEETFLKIVREYDVENVSKKIVRIIHSYTDYVNRIVWKKY